MFDRYDAQVEARKLAADDEATVRYGMSGLDEHENSLDDYTIHLEFLDATDVCDIPITFAPILPNPPLVLGRCLPQDELISNNHYRLTDVSLTFNDAAPWWFGVSPDLIFSDGFESGDTSAWDDTVPSSDKRRGDASCSWAVDPRRVRGTLIHSHLLYLSISHPSCSQQS